MYADGIRIDYERAVRIAKAHYAVLLLQEAEQQAYSHSQDSSNDVDEPTLKEEYFLNKAVGLFLSNKLNLPFSSLFNES